MNFRLANIDDLVDLKSVYQNIISKMNEDGIQIWDEIYPCEFFHDDIANNSLYVLVENGIILSAFVMRETNTGAECMHWESTNSKALYIDRFGVNINYTRNGIGSIMIKNAVALAKEKGAEFLRLFVVDINKPAINFYLKNGFEMVPGVYHEKVEEDLELCEFGFELRI